MQVQSETRTKISHHMANSNLQAGSKRLEKLYYAVFTL